MGKVTSSNTPAAGGISTPETSNSKQPKATTPPPPPPISSRPTAPQPEIKKWHKALDRLFGKPYFESCTSPGQFSYADFLDWNRIDTSLTKQKARNYWKNAIDRFEKSTLQVLQDAARKMNKEWIAGEHIQFEDDFFGQQDGDRKLEKTRRKVHQVVDHVMSKRQRLRYQEEGLALDKSLAQTRSDEDGDVEDNGERRHQKQQQQQKQQQHLHKDEERDRLSTRTVEDDRTIHSLDLLSSDSIDPDYYAGNVSVSSVDFSDITPLLMDFLVGPGSVNANPSGESFYIVDGINISKTLFALRKENVLTHTTMTYADGTDILSLNFIFFDKRLGPLRDERKKRWSRSLTEEESGLVVKMAGEFCGKEFDECELSMRQLSGTASATVLRSRIYSYILNLLSSRFLWQTPPFFDRTNEDTFTDRYYRPWINAFFGDLDGATLHWGRDRLECGDGVSQEVLIPDVMLTTTQHPHRTVLLCEIKKVGSSQQDKQRDVVKLFIEMKRSLDGLLQAGVDGKVIGILGQDFRVDVWMMDLPYEAIYLPTHLGSFDILFSRYQIGSLLAMAPPLLAAREIVKSTLEDVKALGRRQRPVKETWVRGTFNVQPNVVLSPD
ncbi:hypothetical protein BG015_010248 [Linnemannia schmuckeri]|uniref:Uncharacterized protein n=1 Tax=Linnemannia schmuckeri TaxID=64567 RepID=A0A9P5RUE1_9FUNG|nr:hypothetical protein BG015_010248 [Linnemannia schmuckeri]